MVPDTNTSQTSKFTKYLKYALIKSLLEYQQQTPKKKRREKSSHFIYEITHKQNATVCAILKAQYNHIKYIFKFIHNVYYIM